MSARCDWDDVIASFKDATYTVRVFYPSSGQAFEETVLGLAMVVNELLSVSRQARSLGRTINVNVMVHK